MDLSQLSLASFAPHVGTRFFVADVDDLLLTLEEAVPIGASDDRSFSLVFVADGGAAAPQRTYAFRHESLGEFDMFIVPLGPGREGHMRYQAVFNRGAT